MKILARRKAKGFFGQSKTGIKQDLKENLLPQQPQGK